MDPQTLQLILAILGGIGELTAQGIKVTAALREAQAAGRADLTPEQWAALKADFDAATAKVNEAIAAKLAETQAAAGGGGGTSGSS